MPKAKQVYEWSLLRLAKDDANPGPTEITHAQWQALGEYNENEGRGFFTVQTNGIRFNQFVGVIQVGNQTIEILPKIDRRESEEEETKSKWQQVLLHMLRQCHWLDQHAHQHAPLQIRHRSILEAYLELFLAQCETLLHRGLVKRYRKEEGNKFALKGKLLFAENIRQNALHAERFYTRHPVYDTQHLLNQILVKAIRLVPRLSTRSALKDRVGRLLLDFPDLPDVAVNQGVFERIKYDRKTAHYEEAINIAAMLLLHYRPDVRGGAQNVLAILFDMNELWEEYVFRKLRKVPGYSVLPQRQKVFWRLEGTNRRKVIKPDIVVKKRVEPGGTGKEVTLIIDTKWKIPHDHKPGDEDLKQMFAYNEYWGATHAVLLYPDNVFKDNLQFSEGRFSGTELGHKHGCSLLRVSVLDKAGNALDPNIGSRILDCCNTKNVFADGGSV